MHAGSAIGTHLAPNGGSNGLDPFDDTVRQHAQTLTTPGPMALGQCGEGEDGSGGSGGAGGGGRVPCSHAGSPVSMMACDGGT